MHLDNASSMKGSEKRLQALYKNMNKYADYEPSVVHSLTLVGEKTFSPLPEVVDCFGILQELHIFFSGSPQRWYAHYEAARAFKNGYTGNSKLNI